MHRFTYDNPEHWHESADEARATAVYARDPVIKAAMLRAAEGYDRLERHTHDEVNRVTARSISES